MLDDAGNLPVLAVPQRVALFPLQLHERSGAYLTHHRE